MEADTANRTTAGSAFAVRKDWALSLTEETCARPANLESAISVVQWELMGSGSAQCAPRLRKLCGFHKYM